MLHKPVHIIHIPTHVYIYIMSNDIDIYVYKYIYIHTLPENDFALYIYQVPRFRLIRNDAWRSKSVMML